jgi:hypothetical protein
MQFGTLLAVACLLSACSAFVAPAIRAVGLPRASATPLRMAEEAAEPPAPGTTAAEFR